MVRVKNPAGPCKACCCRQCDAFVARKGGKCCDCTCARLCVDIKNTKPGKGTNVQNCLWDECWCISQANVIEWDSEQCAWVGDAYCGSLWFDFKFEIVECGDSCWLCLSSNCLGIDPPTCDEQGNIWGNCVKFNPADGCGGMLRGCWKQTSFGPFYFDADASNCGDPDCDAVQIVVFCDPATVPIPQTMSGTFQGTGTAGPICKNCDCVCDCICIHYTEGPGAPFDCEDIATACWDENYGAYRAKFPCKSGTQEVTITLRDDGTGCCWWHLELSKGRVIGSPLKPVDCPRATLHWDIEVPVPGFGTGSMQTGWVDTYCWPCDECEINVPCCDNPIPRILYATVCDSNCPCDCWPLVFQGGSDGEYIWYGKGPAKCSEGAAPDPGATCETHKAEIELVCRPIDPDIPDMGYQFYLKYYCDGQLMTETEVGGPGTVAVCDPFCILDIQNFEEVICPTGSSNCVGVTTSVFIRKECLNV